MREKRGCQMRFKARRKGVFLNQEHVEGAGLAKSQRASLGHVHTQVALGSRGAQGSWVVLMGSRNLSQMFRGLGVSTLL